MEDNYDIKTVCAKCGGAGKYKPSESFEDFIQCSCTIKSINNDSDKEHQSDRSNSKNPWFEKYPSLNYEALSYKIYPKSPDDWSVERALFLEHCEFIQKNMHLFTAGANYGKDLSGKEEYNRALDDAERSGGITT